VAAYLANPPQQWGGSLTGLLTSQASANGTPHLQGHVNVLETNQSFRHAQGSHALQGLIDGLSIGFRRPCPETLVTTIDLSSASLPASAQPARTRLIHALFFFSGFPALIYQLTWQRSLFRIFGVNTESVTIVVTAFMLGLGLGSLAGGWITRYRKIDALLLLGVIELATAAFGVGSLALFEQVGQLALHWSLPAAAAVNLLLVIVPTLLMGATLPILISHVARITGAIGSAVGTLYYVNTLGAGVACLLCVAVIFPFSGMHAAVWIAAAINVVVGVGALLARSTHRVHSEETDAPVSTQAGKPPILSLRFVAALAALGGFVSLSYEIFLFRTVSFASGSSSIAFALTLSAFLAGIAGGSHRAGKACESLAPAEALRKAVSELMWANLFGAAFLPLLTQSAWIGSGVIGVAIAMVYLIARQWGVLLPYLSQFGVAADERAGMRAALLYFSNIVGCAAGAILTGFVLTDQLGLRQISIVLLAIGSACTLLLIARLDAGARLRRAGAVILILLGGAACLPYLSDRLFENLQDKGKSDHAFAHVVENKSGVITVDTDGTVFGNGMYDGRFNTDLKHDRNAIIRPYALSLFHPAPRDVLMVGLSTGSWAQVLANNPAVASLTIVEINRGYLELIAQQPEVQTVLRNPKVTIVTDDGRRWLNRHPDKRFDAVVSNTTWHFRANATNLLSVEFLQLVRQHLKDGGIFFYNTTNSRRVQRTACLAFPFGARFNNHMVVSDTPIDWNYSRWRDILGSYSIDGKAEFDLTSADDRAQLVSLIHEYRKDGSMIEDCPTLLQQTADKERVTDDNMGTEWRAYFRSE
jgi:predicted membrane-bound spermidine synthase